MPSEPTVAELYARAADAFAGQVRAIGGHWTAPTPCAGWDVRALVQHVVEEDLWTVPLFAGRTVAEVGDVAAGDPLDAAAAAREAVAADRGDGAHRAPVVR
ncbi:DinB family protein [Dactylosporangium cerinum]